MPSNAPTFDDWVEHSLTKGYRVFHGEEAEDPRLSSIDEGLLVDYLTRLFEDPSELATRYSRDQIADATWFLFGCASGYFSTVRHAHLAIDRKVRCFRSVASIYTNLYDRLCTQDSETDRSDSDKLDGAVYMIWDMDCIEVAVMFPEEQPELLEPGFQILETVLQRCLTGACLKSALHGLGHIQMYHPERVSRLIDAFLTRRVSLAPWLRDYAEQAREGRVQ